MFVVIWEYEVQPGAGAAFQTFLEAAQVRYAQIDALGDTLTLAERCIGRYETPC